MLAFVWHNLGWIISVSLAFVGGWLVCDGVKQDAANPEELQRLRDSYEGQIRQHLASIAALEAEVASVKGVSQRYATLAGWLKTRNLENDFVEYLAEAEKRRYADQARVVYFGPVAAAQKEAA